MNRRDEVYMTELLNKIREAGIIEYPEVKNIIRELDEKYLDPKRKRLGTDKNVPYNIISDLRKKGMIETLREKGIVWISVAGGSKQPQQKIEKENVVVKKVKKYQPCKKDTISIGEKIKLLLKEKKNVFSYKELSVIFGINYGVGYRTLSEFNKAAERAFGKPFCEINREEKRITVFKDYFDTVEEKKQPVVETVPVEEMKKEETISPEKEEYRTAYIKFAVGGILRSLDKLKETKDLEENLKDYFGLEVDWREIILVLKTDHEFTLVDGGRLAGLRNKDNSWKTIKAKYSPCNYRERLLMRISMSKNEVEKYFEGTDTIISVVSKISAEDNIYCIDINKSATSKRRLLRLVKSFRQRDKILDEEVETRVLNEMIDEEERAYKFYCPLEIENLD